jgi:hypothetical protein
MLVYNTEKNAPRTITLVPGDGVGPSAHPPFDERPRT